MMTQGTAMAKAPIKATVEVKLLLALGLIWVSGWVSGCASSGAPLTQVPRISSAQHTQESPFLSIHQTPNVSRLWQRRFDGVITDLSISRDGRSMVMATRPDPEITKTEWRSYLYRLNSRGKKIWRARPRGPVKDLVLSPDGRYVVITSYDDSIYALNDRGRFLWESKGQCQPFVLSQISRIVCYHDDDADSDVAFHLLNLQGQKTGEFALQKGQDVLVLKTSKDQSWVAVALTEGKVLAFKAKELLHAKPKPSFEISVNKEVSDLSISSGDHPRLAVLTTENKTEIFDDTGKRISVISLEENLQQVEISPGGRVIGLYGNSQQSQQLIYVYQESETYEAVWKRVEKGLADYSSKIQVEDTSLIARFETEDETLNRVNKLIAFDSKGKPEWVVSVKNTEGVYVLRQDYLPNEGLLYFVTDDGQFQSWKVPVIEY